MMRVHQTVHLKVTLRLFLNLYLSFKTETTFFPDQHITELHSYGHNSNPEKQKPRSLPILAFHTQY